MPINTRHSAYEKQTDDWTVMRDVIEGHRAIRAKITTYLPVPPGLVGLSGGGSAEAALRINAGSNEQQRYVFYSSFAEFPELVAPMVNALQGIVHEKPPTIELPSELEYLTELATPDGNTLLELWERVTRELFSIGRMSLLAEVIDDSVFLCPYVGESLINWFVLPKLIGGGPVLVILEECTDVPKEDDRYSMQEVKTWRELELVAGDPPTYRVRVWESTEGKEPAFIVDEDTDAEGWIVPQLFGKPFAEVPITVVNAVTRGFEYGNIPLMQPARRCISIFRKSADYNRALYVKGDPQAVLFGVSLEEAPTTIGGGALWCFPNAEGSASYMDIDGQGIPLMKESIDSQYERIGEEVGRLVSSGDSVSQKSGEAIRRESATQQVTVKSVVINAAAAMEGALRQIGRMHGMAPESVDKIVFTANTDFTEPMMTGRELLDYVMAKNQGAPMSDETVHNIMRKHKITEMTYDEEEAALAEEEPDLTLDPNADPNAIDPLTGKPVQNQPPNKGGPPQG